MFDQRSQFGSPSIYQPVIWDRLRNQRGMNPYDATEGARPAFAGGGSGFGFKSESITSPSGLTVNFDTSPDGHLDVSFHKPGVGVPEDNSSPSMKDAIGTLEEVFSHLKSYVAANKPKSVGWVAASDSLQKVYDKAAPLIAKQLGGRLDLANDGIYQITLPRNK